MSTVTDVLKPGEVIQDTYRIDKLLGEGGMGATFAGFNVASDHPVAIKVISASFAQNTRATDLFKREANLLRTIQHEAVVRYETTLQDKAGRLYLVMELLPGHSLQHFIDRGAKLSAEDTLRLGRRLAAGLDAVAAVGAVHRDIAPDNIFVVEDDIQRSKLIDFGLASDTFGTEKSILGSDFAGKFSYSAPEQLGQSAATVSPKTDAYALGLVLMKVFGLDVPGEGKGPQAGAFRRTDIEIPKDMTGAALYEALSHLLKHDPDERPTPLTPVFEDALARETGDRPIRSDETEVAVEGARTAKGPKTSKANRGLLIGVAASVGVAAIAAAAFLFLPSDDMVIAPGLDEQIGLIETAQTADDPLQEYRQMIASGEDNALNAALGGLMQFGGDDKNSDPDRIAALILAAEMADPDTFDPSRSPFDNPEPSMARRLYTSAADLGSEPAARAAARLED